ncbi:hypothetical protein [Aestuariimicrobium sp. T2.26MG-19.2B]|uniref:hypothetical protein n=1 Tax=Aestuariimicrobium sp. T2.26MG-19.2B TaxID=3040679 RepID=UPI0024778815|nr:hypothetical protein [Aestuariimicrobium sp. T2.26MG-19.2B]CAI9402419.1 hypothetical protein AESSP_00796 [Aestuariimicrobium sp. T2.26MG-19.2B]
MAEYVLRPRPAIRAFAVAAVLSVIGAVMVVGGQLASSTTWVTITGVVVLALAVALVALAWLASRTNAVTVQLDAEGYRVLAPKLSRGGGGDRHGRWSEVTKVGASEDGSHLVISHGEVERVHIWSPLGGSDPQMLGLQAEIVERLDADRGYTHFG